jgi:hypothetical protein
MASQQSTYVVMMLVKTDPLTKLVKMQVWEYSSNILLLEPHNEMGEWRENLLLTIYGRVRAMFNHAGLIGDV